MIKEYFAGRARAQLITEAEAENEKLTAAQRQLARDAELAATRWKNEVGRIRDEISKATAAGKRFLVIDYHHRGASYQKFVKAVVEVSNECNVESLSFTHQVKEEWNSASSTDECVVLTLSLLATARKAA